MKLSCISDSKRLALSMVLRAANMVGLKITRRHRYPICNMNLLDLAVPAALFYDTSFFFIQIGANDGFTNDPLHGLILKHGLRGILIEPLDWSFSALSERYRGNDRVLLENVAISREDGYVSMYVPIGSEGSVDRSQKSSIMEGNTAKHFGGIGSKMVRAKTMTVQSLVKKHGIGKVTLLQIDTEGFDYQIIKQFFELGLFPTYLHFESLHLGRKEMEECRDSLGRNGSSWVESTVNTLAVRMPEMGSHSA